MASTFTSRDRAIARSFRTSHPGLMDLVSVAGIARRAGVMPDTVHSWRRRHSDTFPPPLVTLSVGAIWSWPDVEAWLARPRRPGRPRKP